MIEWDFIQFHEQQFLEKGYELYILKNGLGDILYIGISTKNIWERWFGRGGHMMWDGNVIYGESPIGVKIEYHLPESLNWKIQLWTLKDCVRFCRKELPADKSEVVIHEVEPIMIRIQRVKKRSNLHERPMNCTGKFSTRNKLSARYAFAKFE